MYVNTLGLVLRETRYKESSKMLTVLTAAEGKISVSARGAMRKGSKIAAAAQLLALSDMTLLNTNGRWILTEARSVEQFRGLRSDVEKLALGSYFSELLETVSDEDSPDPAILTLGLNAVYALSESIKPDRLVKAAFELRLMCLAGFAPQLGACSVCGNTGEAMALDLIGGTAQDAAVTKHRRWTRALWRPCGTSAPVRRKSCCPSSWETRRRKSCARRRRSIRSASLTGASRPWIFTNH